MSQNISGTPKLSDTQLLKTQAWLNGRWVDAPSRFGVINPATGQSITEVPD